MREREKLQREAFSQARRPSALPRATHATTDRPRVPLPVCLSVTSPTNTAHRISRRSPRRWRSRLRRCAASGARSSRRCSGPTTPASTRPTRATSARGPSCMAAGQKALRLAPSKGPPKGPPPGIAPRVWPSDWPRIKPPLALRLPGPAASSGPTCTLQAELARAGREALWLVRGGGARAQAGLPAGWRSHGLPGAAVRAAARRGQRRARLAARRRRPGRTPHLDGAARGGGALAAVLAAAGTARLRQRSNLIRI